MVSLKYLSNFWRTFKIPLINCETNLILTWSESCVLSDTNANQATKSAITDKKLYVPIATLSTQDNAKLLQQLKSGFKRTINQSKYQSKITTQAVKRYLDYLVYLSFQGANRLFILSFENVNDRTVHTEYSLREMITEPVVCLTIIILKVIIR